MDVRTIRALTRWNREFYERHAAEFAATRERPWPGWGRVLRIVRRELLDPATCPDTTDILDVGCGNGRFGAWLLENASIEADADRIRYLGIDASAALVRAARARLGDRVRIERLDVLGDGTEIVLPANPERFALIVTFGFLHHVPGRQTREHLLRKLHRRLVTGGLLVATFWQFLDRDRFRARMVDWDSHNSDGADFLDPGEIEAGDTMLAWGPRQGPGSPPGPRRYCHHAEPGEARDLLRTAGFEALEWWRDDGEDANLNLYVVARAVPREAGAHDDETGPARSREPRSKG